MGQSQASKNVKQRDIRAGLVERIRAGKNNDLVGVPTLPGGVPLYVSRKEALEKDHLSEQELKALEAHAIVATKKGQVGVFYPEPQIRVLKEQKAAAEVPSSFVSEAAISRFDNCY